MLSLCHLIVSFYLSISWFCLWCSCSPLSFVQTANPINISQTETQFNSFSLKLFFLYRCASVDITIKYILISFYLVVWRRINSSSACWFRNVPLRTVTSWKMLNFRWEKINYGMCSNEIARTESDNITSNQRQSEILFQTNWNNAESKPMTTTSTNK